MKLVIMTKSTFFVEEDKILTSLFEEGMDNLHLNKPGQAPMYSERLLTLLSEDYYSKITVHDHFYLKSEYKLRGIHIEDIQESAPEGYRGNVTRTCTKLEDLKIAKKNANYVFLRPVFDSLRKGDKAGFTMEQLQEAARRGLIDKKVYAMGGMNIDNIRIAKDLGFGGVVVCSDLWNRFDIHHERDYRELITHFERLNKAVD